ncbi:MULTISPECIES: DUF3302 domain-containing protein [Alphaproteobacteria]|uniref:DUF3302 domain-containing protein n=1 Tax=Alphaproteobacteria TaxID=28211 RepID=UPI0012BCAC02|nr:MULTISPECIES: DUF3302 domain-containing protein [Alphaproteobacteria]MTH96838.1 DUF3302 domain-containing protein [Roseibium sp. RKSG952]
MGLLGQPLGYYDYLTFVALILLLAAVMALFLFLMGLPGRIAIKRNHPHAEAVKIMGWMGFLAVVPWVHAFMWAFHDGVTVDLRRMPDDERDAIRDEIKRLGGKVKPEYRDRLDTDDTEQS